MSLVGGVWVRGWVWVWGGLGLGLGLGFGLGFWFGLGLGLVWFGLVDWLVDRAVVCLNAIYSQ